MSKDVGASWVGKFDSLAVDIVIGRLDVDSFGEAGLSMGDKVLIVTWITVVGVVGTV